MMISPNRPVTPAEVSSLQQASTQTLMIAIDAIFNVVQTMRETQAVDILRTEVRRRLLFAESKGVREL